VIARILATLCPWSFAACAAAAGHDIDAILRGHLDKGRGTAIIAALVDETGLRMHAHGLTEEGGPPVDGDTVFEIGSITKVFTALLLAEMARKREVGFHDPIAKLLPPSIEAPRGNDITLLHLARHTAGLARLPGNLAVTDPADPYAGYSVDKAFEEIAQYRGRRAVGTRYSYSNYGFGLLGSLLARRSATDYASLVRTRVLEPLGMTSTSVEIDPRKSNARGHGSGNKPVPYWHIPGLEGAGALRSTANDMARFVRAQLGLDETPLLQAMRATHETREDRQAPDLESGLGWIHTDIGGKRYLWHNGGTGGFRSFIALDPKARRGVVLLSNGNASVDEAGMYLITRWPPRQ
jgi:serine-type D-Ala-D-Ala carboxypeptidase/endopeptidase